MTNRWDELSAATAVFHDQVNQEHFVAGRLATWIGNAFAAYVNAPDDARIKYYKYDAGHDAEHDSFTGTTNGFQAVTKSKDNRWQFGLGIVLERSPGARPRFEFRWPMYVSLGDPIEVEVGVSHQKVAILEENGRHNLEPLCEHLFEALKTSLGNAANDSVNSAFRIGFIAV